MTIGYGLAGPGFGLDAYGDPDNIPQAQSLTSLLFNQRTPFQLRYPLVLNNPQTQRNNQ